MNFAPSADEAEAAKPVVQRIVSMLTRMTARADHVREGGALDGIDDEYEHRCAEHSHEP